MNESHSLFLRAMVSQDAKHVTPTQPANFNIESLHSVGVCLHLLDSTVSGQGSCKEIVSQQLLMAG